MMNNAACEPFIDAHHHFWDLKRNPYPWLQDEPLAEFRYGDYGALRRDYLPGDFARDTGNDSPCASVHIEAEWSRAAPVDETRWLHAVSDRHGLPTVIVAHAQLDADDVTQVLTAQAAFPRVRGIRHKPAVAADQAALCRGVSGSMDDSRWRNGYAQLAAHGLSFDLQAPWWHLEQAADLARDFPDTTLILNHAGLPADRTPEGLARWRAALVCLAKEPNTAIKLSGMGVRDQPWPEAENIRLMREVIDIFGPLRCMFSSNYPVDSLVVPYPVLLAAFRKAIAPRPVHERQALLQGNARRIYRIPQGGV